MGSWDNPRGLVLFYLKILDEKSLEKIYKNSMFKKYLTTKQKLGTINVTYVLKM